MTDPTYLFGKITRAAGTKVKADGDRLAVEEPLEIRLGKSPIAVTMRTPGNDSELAAGFLCT
jgi:FdhD protein